MSAHTARFDETRFTVDDQYPVALQQFYTVTDWGTFTQEVSRHGEEFKRRQEEIAQEANPGCWCCCMFLCCICGPCIFCWKASKLAEEAKRGMDEATKSFEDQVKQTCRAWQERYGNQVGITLKSEEAQRVQGSGKHVHVTNYRKYWLEFTAIAPAPYAAAVPVAGYPVAQPVAAPVGGCAPAGGCAAPV